MNVHAATVTRGDNVFAMLIGAHITATYLSLQLVLSSCFYVFITGRNLQFMFSFLRQMHCWLYCRLNHPKEVRRRKMSTSAAPEGSNQEPVVVKDFEFARNELAQAQDARWISQSGVSVTYKECNELVIRAGGKLCYLSQALESVTLVINVEEIISSLIGWSALC